VIAVVVLSQLAEDDLLEIWCTVSADDIRAANRGVGIARVVHGARDLAALQMP